MSREQKEIIGIIFFGGVTIIIYYLLPIWYASRGVI